MVRRQCALEYNYLFRIFVLLLCLQNIYCHGMHFLSGLARGQVRCSSCVSYRGLSMRSHWRRTHLDIFCRLCFAPGFLWKIASNLAPWSPTLSLQITSRHSSEPSFHWVFTATTHCRKVSEFPFFTPLDKDSKTSTVSLSGSFPFL